MTAPRAAGRFVLAPIVDGAAAWDRGAPLVLTPIRLVPVSTVVPFRSGRSSVRSR